MRLVILTLCAVLILASFPAPGRCEMDTRLTTLGNTPVNKLIRGLVNCVTFPVELPASICDVSKRKGLLSGCTLGVADGFVTSLLRLGTGLFDAVTFVIPPYDKPLLKPEYAIDSAVDKMGTPNIDW
jgi:putative exosortase-associated protein (TIGR04073 family)